ncbi:hypothetical protein Tco_0058369 [Tanacetum coccineum]
MFHRPTKSLSSSSQTNPKPNPTNDNPVAVTTAPAQMSNCMFLHNEAVKNNMKSTVNLNAKTTTIHDDSEDEADEAENEVESSSSKPTKTDPPQLKAYKPKIPYPQRPRKENMEECYAKFNDLIKEVRINVPLVDVLVVMPNYGKFLKDFVSNKSKMEQISAAFLNEECSAIVQNKLQPKLDLIDEVTEEELDALLDNSEPFSSTSEKINKTSLDKEFEEFMAVNIEEIPKKEEEVEDNFE